MNRLAEIKARAAAATEGPWEWTQYRVPTLEGWKGDPATYRWQTEVLEADHNGECGCRSACQLELTVLPPDAEFIAHARTDVPALVAAVEAVLALHEPVGGPSDPRCCPVCVDLSGEYAETYPCGTATAILAALGALDD